jgi:hypothetical protein
MRRDPGLAAVLLGAWLAAQQPMPVDAQTWSAADARAFAGLLRLRTALTRGEPAGSVPAAVANPPAHDLVVVADVGGDVVFAPNATEGRRFFVLAWPKDGQKPPRHAMLLFDDGTALAAEIAHVDGTSRVQHLFAAGGGTRFADVLRQPGRSSYGDLWLLLDQVSTTEGLQVVDEHGVPLANVVVSTGPADAADPLGDVSLSGAAQPDPHPIACASTDKTGRARLRGPRGPATCLRLDFGSGAQVLASELRFERSDGALRIVADLAAIRARRAQAAAAVLTAVAAAEERCRGLCAIDANRDHDGEYGTLGQLSDVKPRLLGDAFRDVREGRVAIGGYLFQVWLPSRDGRGVADSQPGFAPKKSVDPRRARELWCAYAWPAEPALGGPVLFVNQTGQVFASDNDDRRYAGPERAPAAEAAFMLDGSGALDTKPANDGRGRDGWPWHLVR